MFFRGVVLLFTVFSSVVLGMHEDHYIFGMSSAIIYPIVTLIIGLVIIFIEIKAHGVSGRRLFFAGVGLLLGVVLGKLLGSVFVEVFSGFSESFGVIFVVMMAYVGFTLAWLKADEIHFPSMVQSALPSFEESSFVSRKLLDTSVIIDGRIADISEIGFLEGDIIVPRFVLHELQQVADSSDPLKRSRGRRGLDILNKMKGSKKTTIKIVDDDFSDVVGVDSKLLKLAHTYGDTVVITNDYNLNKVAVLQGVPILNINELANAVKPSLIPTEVIKITVVKEGKDQNQGIAYLNDGTMIVVDNGKNYIGKEIFVSVTSVLQTPAGRMIFTEVNNECT